MDGERLKSLREQRELTQTQLAERAAVSRQLVGALEKGRHLPRVDAAIRLASALGVEVTSLFATETEPRDVVSGEGVVEGALVRTGQVGEQTVFSVARVQTQGWDVADGVVEAGRIEPLTSLPPGPVMAGCEPGLEALERTLRESGRRALAVACSTRAALIALDSGRAHVSVVHGEREAMPQRTDMTRFRLCSWRVGLAASPDAESGWEHDALSGRVPVVQRESGAAVQRAFESRAGSVVPGPRAVGHLEAARLAVTRGMAAVTIEPAAIATGARFHPLETHLAELWTPEQWTGDPSVEAVLNEVTGSRFRSRLRGVGGYDLEGIGSRAA